MSHAELASPLGVSRPYISKLLSGEKLLNLEKIAQIQKIFNTRFYFHFAGKSLKKFSSLQEPLEKKQAINSKSIISEKSYDMSLAGNS